jgi:AraC family transcriptional regulator of adaptative response/methylated-DNA-[protein]-cysteine methyltransferase
MDTQETLNYKRIADAIDFIRTNYHRQPPLDEIARKVHVSPYHFQRLFSEWAGTSPKKFLQYVTIAHAKRLLKEQQATLLDTAMETGLSGTGRLHDMFITIEGMTPAEYKNGGVNLSVNYSFAETPFGNVIIASTPKGICHLAFSEDDAASLATLRHQFPAAQFIHRLDRIQQNALFIFTQDWKKLETIKLHLKGTGFQLKVWETLLKIPMGQCSTYGSVAKAIRRSRASRAVGTAIGDNPVAYLIPCHRVIKSTGAFGQYHWGETRKIAMLGWETARLQPDK